MKKIFMASLVAMMAVTAANAEIASTNFVTDRTGDVANSNYVKTLDDKTLTGAVDDLDNRISNMSEVTGETLSDLGTQIGKAQGDATSALNQIAALDNTYVTDSVFNADKQAQDGKISALETSLSATGTTGKAIAAAQAQADKGVQDAAAAQTDVNTVETNLGPLNGVKIANACTTGRCALVWENGQAKWETINY